MMGADTRPDADGFAVFTVTSVAAGSGLARGVRQLACLTPDNLGFAFSRALVRSVTRSLINLQGGSARAPSGFGPPIHASCHPGQSALRHQSVQTTPWGPASLPYCMFRILPASGPLVKRFVPSGEPALSTASDPCIGSIPEDLPIA